MRTSRTQSHAYAQVADAEQENNSYLLTTLSNILLDAAHTYTSAEGTQRYIKMSHVRFSGGPPPNQRPKVAFPAAAQDQCNAAAGACCHKSLQTAVTHRCHPLA